MRTVWKFPIQIVNEQRIKVPPVWNPVLVGVDPHGDLCIWAEVQAGEATKERIVNVHGTGHAIGDNEVHLGSAVVGQYVWHVYI